VIKALRSSRPKAGFEVLGAVRFNLNSAASIRLPTIAGCSARTTCSTSGSSGIDHCQLPIFDCRLKATLL